MLVGDFHQLVHTIRYPWTLKKIYGILLKGKYEIKNSSPAKTSFCLLSQSVGGPSIIQMGDIAWLKGLISMIIKYSIFFLEQNNILACPENLVASVTFLSAQL